ncbi:MAG TPA: hypothetical protein VD902_03520 [Symbiobacteriaceae bacterium]|nr:hypothetical protein [Symbiobacteriaceae bacterium]
MNRALSGTVAIQETGRPLPGLQVVAARLVPGGVEPLGTTLSREMGRFRVTYEPLPEPADLFLYVYSPTGRLIYTEPIHRAICGAELRLRVEIPAALLSRDLH